MDSFKFHDVRSEKANAISKYRKIQRIAILFRFVEILVFAIIVSRCFAQFAFSFKISADHLREVSSVLVSPRFVFIIGNAIVVALLLLSGQFSSARNGAKIDLYDEYVEECKKNQPQIEHKTKHEKVNKICRSHSANVERAAHLHDRDCRRKLRRSVTERCHRKSTTESDQKIAPANEVSSSYAEDEMSSEEFRRTVEAFIERQQRSLREEEDFSAAVVSFEK